MRDHLAKPYADLHPSDQDDNRAAARRIPDILALVGLTIEPSTAATIRAVKSHINLHLELLAEAEHDGWVDHKLRNGWRFDEERNDEKKLHDCLNFFRDLSEQDKEKDRDSVLHFQDHLRRAGYRIIFTKGGAALSEQTSKKQVAKPASRPARKKKNA